MMRTATFLLSVLLAVPAASAQTANPASGTVRGIVQDELRRPLSNATVWLQIRRANEKDRPRPFHQWTKTGSGGQFQFSGVPTGRFILCAQLPGSDLVDSCQWDSQPPSVVVSGAAAVNVPAITLQKGYPLRVRIDDPRGDLSVQELRTQGAGVRLGVWTPTGMFVPLALRYKEPRGEEHEAVLPYRTPLRLLAQGQRFVLADERGNAIDNRQGVRLPLLIQPGKEPKLIRFEVKGVEKP
jgi:hypothetical protein